MKRKQGLNDYLWKAELQQNGQLHYHIGTSTYLPQNIVRWKWNKDCKSAGLLDAFAHKYGHFNPPSTEVKSIIHVQDAKSYIAKEFAKKETRIQQVGGKVWDCNEELKRGYFSTELTGEVYWKLHEAIKKKQVIQKNLMEAKCAIILTPEPKKFLSQQILSSYQKFIS